MRKFEQFRNFVIGLSGANREVLGLVPSERTRFESLGWAILITSGMAAISMWFALASAVGINGIIAVPPALLWGLAIMGIDRWLITSMPIDGGRKFAVAAPRIALAVLLGTLISTPLVLRIFQSEVNAQIALMQQKNYNSFLQQQQSSLVSKQVSTYGNELHYLNQVIDSHGAVTGNTASDPRLVAYNKQLDNLNSELTHWTNLKAQYYNEYICQLYGGPSCPKKGYGPAAKDSQQNYQAASQEVNTIKGQINQVQGQVQQRDAQLSSTSKADEQNRYAEALSQQPVVKNEYDTAVQRQNELQASYFAQNQAAHGILARLEALSQLSKGNFTVTSARFLLFLLFLVIEILPVTVKLLQRPGVYEEGLRKAKDAERRDFHKYFNTRSRRFGPAGDTQRADYGPTVLQLQPEPASPVNSIWNRTRMLPRGQGDSADEQLTETIPYRASGWGTSGYAGPGAPDAAPRAGQTWHGEDRWRNNWQRQPGQDAADGQEPARPQQRRPEPGQRDAGGQKTSWDDPAADPHIAETRPDHRYPGGTPRSGVSETDYARGASPGNADDGYPDEGYSDEGYDYEARDARPPGRGGSDLGDSSGSLPAGSDAAGPGTLLSWDDE